jgi:hypothetical protein
MSCWSRGSAGQDEPVPSETAAYKLTLLKKLSQSTKPSKIKETITDLLVVQGLYRDFLPILCALDLNHEGVWYYAHSVIKSEIFQVTHVPVKTAISFFQPAFGWY